MRNAIKQTLLFFGLLMAATWGVDTYADTSALDPVLKHAAPIQSLRQRCNDLEFARDMLKARKK